MSSTVKLRKRVNGNIVHDLLLHGKSLMTRLQIFLNRYLCSACRRRLLRVTCCLEAVRRRSKQKNEWLSPLTLPVQLKSSSFSPLIASATRLFLAVISLLSLACIAFLADLRVCEPATLEVVNALAVRHASESLVVGAALFNVTTHGTEVGG